MESHEYDSWYLMGHSMGGLAACSYASEHVSEIDGIIYLASYPSAGPFEGMKMLSVYGTEDGCLSRDEYEKSRGYWPDDAEEHVIQGGNHAQFGGYGSQKGDGEAAVTAEEQQKETVEVVRKWLGQ
jgi:pimeloyl-ACP methyl ester carboxylesterase